MKKFKIEWEEVASYTVTIEAKDKEEAEEKLMSGSYTGEQGFDIKFQGITYIGEYEE